MEENTEENIVENMVDNMVDNMGEVLLAAKNQRSSARGRDPEIRPIRSSEEMSWRSMLPGGSEEEEPVDGRSGPSAPRHPSPWSTPLEVVVTIGLAVKWNLIFSDGMESGC